MFDTLFHYPRVLARHRDGPLSQERELFLNHCAKAGATRSTLLCLASELLLVARYLNLSDNRLIDRQEIEVAIGDHLGHRSSDATRTYAKVDLVGLIDPAQISLNFL